MEHPADYADYLAYHHALVGALSKCARAMRMLHAVYYALPLPGEPTQDRRTQLVQLLDTELALLQVTLRLQEQADALRRLRREGMPRAHAAQQAARPPGRSPDARDE